MAPALPPGLFHGMEIEELSAMFLRCHHILIIGLLFMLILLSAAPNFAQSRAAGRRPVGGKVVTAKKTRSPRLRKMPYELVLPVFKKNIDLNGGVMAAEDQVYKYHWLRDGAIVIEELISLLERSNKKKLAKHPKISSAEQNQLLKKIIANVEFSRQLQIQEGNLGLSGVAKYHSDGRPFEKWSNPQFDGEALRACSLIRLANDLLDEKPYLKKNLADSLRSTLLKKLYVSQLPAESVIKYDLENVARNYEKAGYDLWEETWGLHFFTLMVQRRALKEGARLASRIGDQGAADFYDRHALKVEEILKTRFLADGQDYVPATLPPPAHKSSNLDTGVVLGFIYGKSGPEDPLFSRLDPLIQRTLERLESEFRKLYPINNNGVMGTAIGRYPEDTYSSAHSAHRGLGNPWVLTTLGFAKIYYDLAINSSETDRARGLFSKADEFLARVRYHSYDDGHLSEMFDRNTGYMSSVPELTWNYAILSDTLASRQSALDALNARRSVQ